MKKGVLVLSVIFALLILSGILIQAQEALTANTDNSDEPIISSSWQSFFKLIFKIQEVKFSDIVIMSALLILAILIIQQALSFGFEDKTSAWLIAIILSLIASSSGGMIYIGNLWKRTGEMLKIPSNASVFWISAGIVLLVVAYVLLKYFSKTMEEAEVIVNAKKLGAIEGLREAKEKIKAKFDKIT